MSRKNLVVEAEKSFQTLKEQHKKLETELNRKVTSVTYSREQLGKSVLSGEGSLSELASELAKTEHELRVLEKAKDESLRLLSDAERGLLSARREQAIETISQVFQEANELNASAGELLAGVYEHIEKLEALKQEALNAYSENTDTMNPPTRQPVQVKVDSLRKMTNNLRLTADTLQNALGG